MHRTGGVKKWAASEKKENILIKHDEKYYYAVL